MKDKKVFPLFANYVPADGTQERPDSEAKNWPSWANYIPGDVEGPGPEKKGAVPEFPAVDEKATGTDSPYRCCEKNWNGARSLAAHRRMVHPERA